MKRLMWLWLGACAVLAGVTGQVPVEESGLEIEEILPRVYDHLGWILIPTLLALAAGFILHYRKGSEAGRAAAGDKGRG